MRGFDTDIGRSVLASELGDDSFSRASDNSYLNSVVHAEAEDALEQRLIEVNHPTTHFKDMERPVSGRGTFELARHAMKQGSAPIKLSFQNMSYTVKGRKILNSVTGYALPGHTHYIMGATGAGKTTMLNAIAGRINQDSNCVLEGGKVMINDAVEVTCANFGKYGGYVMQEDILFEFFTVKECLTFAARLKLSHLSFGEQDARVNKVMNDMGLVKCANTQAGTTSRKTISGGERKRTCIAIELISDPSLLILDEPTSGLDSFKSIEICRLLFDLARMYGKTIIATIHSPSSTSFNYFDRLFLMSEGRIVYQGRGAKCNEYFSKIGYPLPKLRNPADSLIKIISSSFPQTEEDIKKL